MWSSRSKVTLTLAPMRSSRPRRMRARGLGSNRAAIEEDWAGDADVTEVEEAATEEHGPGDADVEDLEALPSSSALRESSTNSHCATARAAGMQSGNVVFPSKPISRCHHERKSRYCARTLTKVAVAPGMSVTMAGVAHSRLEVAPRSADTS